MNKATIITDAITYIETLQKSVRDLSNQLFEMEATCEEQLETPMDAMDAAEEMCLPTWPASKTHLTCGFLFDTNVDAISAMLTCKKWADATHFTFSQTQNYRNTNLQICFHRLNHGNGSPFDGAGGTLAHEMPPTHARFHFDADELWVVGAVHGGVDKETVALHEIRHLGLGHSSDLNAIMYACISPGVTEGLHAMYKELRLYTTFEG